MKRPKAIFLIIVLCLIASRSVLVGLSKVVEKYLPGDRWSPLFAVLSIVGLIFILWLLAGLSQLRPRVCWIAVGFFSLDLVVKVLTFQTMIQAPRVSPPAAVCFMALELAAIWYLTRPSFRDFAKNYSDEQDREKSAKEIQKLSLKKISKGLWS